LALTAWPQTAIADASNENVEHSKSAGALTHSVLDFSIPATATAVQGGRSQTEQDTSSGDNLVLLTISIFLREIVDCIRHAAYPLDYLGCAFSAVVVNMRSVSELFPLNVPMGAVLISFTPCFAGRNKPSRWGSC